MTFTGDMPEEWRLPPQERNQKVPTTFTGNELRAKEFPPVSWAIPEILPSGVTLFGGREKMGKSWMAFGLALSVATGGVALGSKRVQQGDAFYLSLEDGERRLHRRIDKLASHASDLSRLHYVTEWEPIDRGGLEDLDAWLGEHPGTRLVVIDTLKRIRQHTSGRRNMYDDDYEAVQPFVPLASEHDVSILLIHHLNQQAAPDDPFDWFSGSAGLVAAAEGILLFRRKRGDADAFLTVDDKDIEERKELAVKWDALAATWSIIGDADAHRISETRAAILQVFQGADEPLSPADVSDILDQPRNTIKQRMYQMSKDGKLKVKSRGLYTLPPTNDHNQHNQHNQEAVTEVTEVTDPNNQNGHHSLPSSADEGNEWVQRLMDAGISEEDAVKAVMNMMKRSETT